MDIRNPIQFRNFMVAHGLRDINSVVSQTCKCVDEYDKLCGNCTSERPSIEAKYKECANLYVLAIQQTFPTSTKIVMSKAIVENSIAFYKDAKHIKTITR